MTDAIGALRHRLTLERIDATPVGGGAQDAVWVAVAELSAAIRPLGGREITGADSFHGTVTHTIRLRYRAEIVPEMRFRMATRVFNIRAVIDRDERKRWLDCQCEEQRL
jgi:SPP1 family predicted phage head-tail adaptor